MRDIIADEINFLKSRPGIRTEGDNSGKLRKEIDVSDAMSKSIRDETDDTDTQSKSVERSSTFHDKSDTLSSENSNNPNDISFNENKNKTQNGSSSRININNIDNRANKRMLSEPKRSDQIKRRPPVSYNENDILDEYLMCARSICVKFSSHMRKV